MPLHACLCRVPHKTLSEPFDATLLDLQARLESGIRQPDPETCDTKPPVLSWEVDKTLDVTATDSGVWNAVVIWFEVQLPHACALDMWHKMRPPLRTSQHLRACQLSCR